MEEIIRVGHCDADELRGLVDRAAAELSKGEKRRFIFNLAQLFQSKGSLSTPEYELILDLAEKLGVPETEADAMLHSVYNLNDTFLAIMGMLAFGAIIYLTRSVLIPLVISIFLTMIINRIDSLIASGLKLRGHRWLTKLGAMVVILGILFGLVMAAIDAGNDIADRYTEIESRFETVLRDSETARGALAWLTDSGVLAQLQQFPIGDMVSSLFSLLTNFVLIVIFTGFMVFSSPTFTGVLDEMDKKVGTYISTKSLISLLTGFMVFILCTIFGIDFALFWALLAFLLNFIPSVGAIIASLPPILLAMVQLDSWTGVVLFTLILTSLNVLLGQVLEPKLLGSRLALKPVAILIGLIFWGLLWGIPGMFLATPLMVLIKILASNFNISRSFERMLSSDTI